MNSIIIAKEILRLAKEIMAIDNPDGTGKCDVEGTKTPFTGIPRKVNNGTKSEQPNAEQPAETNPSNSSSPGQKLRNAVYDAIVNNKPFPEELKDKEDEIRRSVSRFTPNDTVMGFDSNCDVNISNELVHNGELVINFGTIEGYFSCSCRRLTSLEGCPNEVHGSFYCRQNSISVEEFKDHHPDTIDGEIVVDKNIIETAKQIYPNNNVM